jgi:cyclase
MQDIEARIFNGADKICVNQVLFENSKLIQEAAKSFGSQAIIASIDYKLIEGVPTVFSHHGKINTGMPALDWALRVELAGAGEILLNAIDRDGKACGYDINTIQEVVSSVSIPVIACGGAGNMRHFLECYESTNVSAVAAGNFFHFTESAYPRSKTFLKTKLTDIR